MATYMTGIKYGGYLSTARIGVNYTASTNSDIVDVPAGQVWEVELQYLRQGFGGGAGGNITIEFTGSGADTELLLGDGEELTYLELQAYKKLILVGGDVINVTTGSLGWAYVQLVITKYTA